MKTDAATAAPPSSSGRPPGAPGRPPMGRKPPMPETETPLDYRVVARLGREYLARRPWMLVAYVVGSLLCQAVLPPLIALHFSQLTNSAQHTAPVQHDLVHNYGLWVGLTVALIALNFALRYLTTSLDVSSSNMLRRNVFLNILRQSPRFFHERDTGQLTMIVNQLCLEAQMGLRALLLDPILQIISIGAVGTVLYRQISHARQGAQGHEVLFLFGAVAVMAFISPWLISLMAKRLQRAQGLQQRQALHLSTLITGAVSAPEEIQAMRAEETFDRKHAALLRDNFVARMGGTLTLEKLNLLNRLPGDVVLFTLLGGAVYFATHEGGGVAPGTFVAVALLTPQFMQAVQALGSFSISANLRWPSIDLIHTVLASRPTSAVTLPSEAAHAASDAMASAPEAAGVVASGGDAPTLEARNLVFSYRPGELPNVLDDIDFQLPAGKVTGFIARAGQGKTTFFRLALRFYDPQSGEILLDGRRHSGLPVDDLRKEIVLMSQFPAFFIDSVRENFRVANPDSTDEEIRRLCEITPLWAKLQQCFPGDTLDAPFQAGVPLSGGYKKLFALTRCLLRGPRFLFLDEPTTGMDPEEKFGLIEPMRRNCQGKTTLVVDHDILWQLRFCDYFLVLDHGKIVQQGSGPALLGERGLFRELFDEQTRGIRDLAGVLETVGTPANVPDSVPDPTIASLLL